MNKLIVCLLALSMLTHILPAQELVEEQLNYPRVQEAKADYHKALQNQFRQKKVQFPPAEIYLRSFKFDMEVELWAKGSADDDFTLIKVYDICRVSGSLGPKREQGDLQIPEGFYKLEHFNPSSNYHLSMKIDYPNASDRILGNEGNLGGDIFIHGDCVTIGCIPIEDEPMEELYWLSVLAKSNGGSIPIHIYPFKMDESNLNFFKQIPYLTDSDWQFWNQLLPVYKYFESTKKVPFIKVNSKGEYYIQDDDKQANG